ncbi:Mandelate racemase/muconate lactonizing enzyme-like protein [Rubrobacter xylanophilus DSM 9941]|uniref:Mandelate racemase/muconate lactonizing enzyme-like protein n=1 Tax=Rubrobacter xylanophilus (strain DSM 9941 / JCM 11954 / NBRC 16129 / PRD-1) TaxID=266117 RepID=Q1AYK7_RUBXD|nr:mandelate racemase/muconate lactonizing enzyme family protein [Rubrobacter xylanophilus]ABG03521.1 Mandelate racemase/muconate lactonizing enzyme-like protein [Rubrobacter xylanophilus DSM 9941]
MSAPRITRVETAAIRAVGPSVLVRVWAGDEHGLGECYPSAPAAGIHHIVMNMEEQLLGEDPRDVERLYEKMRRWNIFTGGQAGAVITALSGIETALWDLAGKLQGVPVYRLLGGAFRRRVRLYADCNAGTVDAAAHHIEGGLFEEGSNEEYIAVAREAVERGFDAIKLDVDDITGPLHRDFWNGAISPREHEAMVARVAAVREAVGPEVEVAIDMHGRFDIPSSIRFARAMEPFGLLWLEEPTPPENLDALAEVRRSTSTPICAGENVYTRFDFRELFAKRAVDYVMPDVAKCGGLAEAKRIANLAELDYIPFAPHNVSSPVGTVAAAHVCAAVSNFAVLEWHAIDMPHWEDFVRYPGGPVIREGHIELTEEPGLGLELDEEAAFEHRHEKGGVPFFGRT